MNVYALQRGQFLHRMTLIYGVLPCIMRAEDYFEPKEPLRKSLNTFWRYIEEMTRSLQEERAIADKVREDAE